MARLRQINPGNYRAGDRIGQEFESIVRYINAAELGDKTIGELLAILFDGDGEFIGPIEMRLDSTNGLQYRIGTYVDPTDGWQLLAALSDIRGTPGRDVGTVGSPIISNRTEYTASAAQTDFDFTPFTASDDLLVFVDGVLKREGALNDYTKDVGAQTVTFTSAMAGGENVVILRVRAEQVQAYRRSDIVASASQVVFPFEHDDTNVLMVFRNGIIQRFGGTNDYTNDPASDTVSFMTPLSASDLVTIITIDDTATATVSGLMLEDNYTTNGLIRFDKLSISDGAIPAAKVNGLTSLLENRGRIFLSATSPASPIALDLWLDTSSAPNILKVYNGVTWVSTSPNIVIPDFSNIQAGLYLRVNSTGTALEWSTLDLSSRVPTSWVGAANGVASLDASGVIPVSQLPDIFALYSEFFRQTGSISNGDILLKRIYKEKVRIDAIAVKAGAGSCSLQLKIGSTLVGDVINVGTSLLEQNLSSSIEVDANAASKDISVTITSATSLSDLQITLALASVTA